MLNSRPKTWGRSQSKLCPRNERTHVFQCGAQNLNCRSLLCRNDSDLSLYFELARLGWGEGTDVTPYSVKCSDYNRAALLVTVVTLLPARARSGIIRNMFNERCLTEVTLCVHEMPLHRSSEIADVHSIQFGLGSITMEGGRRSEL